MYIFLYYTWKFMLLPITKRKYVKSKNINIRKPSLPYVTVQYLRSNWPTSLAKYRSVFVSRARALSVLRDKIRLGRLIMCLSISYIMVYLICVKHDCIFLFRCFWSYFRFEHCLCIYLAPSLWVILKRVSYDFPPKLVLLYFRSTV
jgi:hypothetical protein